MESKFDNDDGCPAMAMGVPQWRRKRGLLATLATLQALEEDFPDVDEGMTNLDAIEL